MSYQVPSPASSDLSPSPSPSPPPPSKPVNRFAAFSQSNGSSPQHPPSTPERRSLDPIPSTTPLGPPPSVLKQFTTSGRPTGFTRSRDTPKSSQVPKFFSTHTGNARKDALFGKAGAGLGSSAISYGALQSSPPVAASKTGGSGIFAKPNTPASKLNGTTAKAAATDDVSGHDALFARDESLAQISPGDRYSLLLNQSMDVGELPSLMGESGMPDIRHRSPLIPSGKKRARAEFNGGSSKRLECAIAAKGYAASHPPSDLRETDGLILRTESALNALKEVERHSLEKEEMAGMAAGDVLRVWREFCFVQPGEDKPDHNGSTDVAAVLAALLLPLYQSGGDWGALLPEWHNSSSRSPIALPEVLIGWLSRFHPGGYDIIEDILPYEFNGYAKSDVFWDAVTWSASTGRLHVVVDLLQGAKFKEHYRKTFSDVQFDYIDEGVQVVVEMLQKSPALKDGDWDIRGSAWSIHRLQIEKTKAELLQLRIGAGEEEDEDEEDETGSLEKSTRRQALPREIYEALLDVCDVLLGSKTPILAAATDWVEAVFCLTIWWDGEEYGDEDFDYFLNASMSASARNNKRGKPPRYQTRAVDVTPSLAYREHLARVFRQVVSEDDFMSKDGVMPVDLAEPFQITLTCILEGELDGVMRMLASYSLCVTSAVIQIATLGGWLADNMTKPKALLDLTQNDLMVLSYAGNGLTNASSTEAFRDEILAQYAMMVATRKSLKTSRAWRGSFEERDQIPGWELAMSIVAQLDDDILAVEKAQQILDNVPLETTEDVNTVFGVADSYGFGEQAVGLAERHADQLVYSRTNYGEAILCYARSRRIEKLRNLAQSLITFSVVQSAPYPSNSENDEAFKALTRSPQSATDYCTAYANMETAYHFVHSFGGYCALLRFYQLRDQSTPKSNGDMDIDTDDVNDEKTVNDAGAALVELVKAAAEDIRDAEVEDEDTDGLVPVDAIFSLLGEVYGFVINHPRSLSLQHLTTLLSALETLPALSALSLKKAEAVLSASLADFRDPTPSSPPELLKRTSTGLTSSFTRVGTAGSGTGSTGSENFSFVGSSMFNSQVLQPRPNDRKENGSASSSGVLVKSLIKRGWDWRDLVKSREGSMAREEIVKGLRSKLGEMIAGAWVGV